MTAPAGFLEYFILEASDYVEQLDGLLLGGGPNGPDAQAIQRIARALRGTATMAKIPSFAELAAAVERVGRALQSGSLRWEPGLSGVVVGAVDDLKILLHSARTWSAANDQRATARAAELERIAPAQSSVTQPARTTSAPSDAGSPYLATEAANIAAGLELLTTRDGNRETAVNVLRRVRALRGVAGVSEITGLADALEGTEDVARGLESGEEPLSPEAREVLVRAAAHIRGLSTALRTGGDTNAQTPEREAFIAATDALRGRGGDRELVIPIADLFFMDGAPGVVESSANPPTSTSERFRLELVSLGEHLAQVVGAARGAADAASNARSRRDLRRALAALKSAAESFGEEDVAGFIATHVDSTEHLDFLGLAALDDLASLLLEPGADGERLSAHLRETVRVRDLSAAIGSGFGADTSAGAAGSEESLWQTTTALFNEQPLVAAKETGPIAAPVASAAVAAAVPTAAAAAVPAVAPAVVPVGVAEEVPARAPAVVPAAIPAVAPAAMPAVVPAVLPGEVPAVMSHEGSAALIDLGIAALAQLESDPFRLSDIPAVPIETLLYRGRSALDRAVEIRDTLRASPSSQPAALEELFDLLELARAE